MRNLHDELNALIPFQAVSGAERSFSHEIDRIAKSYGLETERDVLGNLLVHFKSHHGPFGSMLFVPIDLPGFLNLYCDGDSAWLSPTSSHLGKDLKFERVFDEAGDGYDLQLSEDSKAPYKICGRKFELGESFGLANQFSKTDERICGYGVARFALIYSALSALSKMKRDSAVCFTVSFHSLAKSESILMSKYRPSFGIFLGFCECQGQDPLLLLKDGKFFPRKRSLERASHLDLRPFVAKEPVTKAETVLYPYDFDLISIALPCSHPLSPQESIFEESVGKMKRVIESVI